MISLISANWLLFLIALVIGIVTAFWTWAASGREGTTRRFNADDGLLNKAGDAVAPEPVPIVPAPTPTPPPAPKPEPAPKLVPETPAAAPVAAASAPIAEPTPRPRKRPVVADTPAPPPTGKPKIAPATGDPDNLRLIKGVGPKLNTLLNNLGITRYDQIAEWREAEIQEVDQYLESFSGRITRDSWIDQAKYLAKDDIAGFEKKYGKL
ncbi:MAG: hypothetical protein V7676_10120 [Parasphingorhabdus sp.]|uniref:hypothetical protein n=1 Tax=Parasphingorhabdus sp. TaxID=2709688 RepID=UPI0030024E9C